MQYSSKCMDAPLQNISTVDDKSCSRQLSKTKIAATCGTQGALIEEVKLELVECCLVNKGFLKSKTSQKCWPGHRAKRRKKLFSDLWSFFTLEASL